MFRGEDFSMIFTAFTKGTDPTELTNRINLLDAAIVWRSKLNTADNEAATLISKSTVIGPVEIEILPQGVADPTRGQYKVKLVTADTNDGVTPLVFGRHVFGTWAVLVGGETHVVVETGELLIKAPIVDLVATPP